MNETKRTQAKMWWFRGLSADLTDPRLHEMSAADFRDLYFLQCVGNQEEPRGSLPPAPACAFHLHKSGAATVALINRLKGWGKLEERDGRLWIADSDQRYRASDDAAARMANARAVRRDGSEHVQNSERTDSERVANPSTSSSSSGASGEESDLSNSLRPNQDEEDVRAVLKLFRTHGISTNPTVEGQIRDGVASFGAPCMEHCLRRAALNNKVSMAYVLASCRGHASDGACPADDEEHLTRRERMTAGKR
jgi:hypothetical protein